MKSLVFLAALAASFATQAADPKPAAKGDPAKGQAIAAGVCAGCHGPDGNSVAPANPKLAGQLPEYLAKQLRNFKAPDGSPERRVNAIMNGMAATVADEDVIHVAAYYASQAPKPEATKEKSSIDIGQKLWRAGDAARGLPACAGCHGPAGMGLPAQFPRLSGQFAEYTEAQLKAFRTGERANDANRMMRMIAVKMTDAEVKAVADYVAGLR